MFLLLVVENDAIRGWTDIMFILVVPKLYKYKNPFLTSKHFVDPHTLIVVFKTPLIEKRQNDKKNILLSQNVC
jgi:hypothetical protein